MREYSSSHGLACELPYGHRTWVEPRLPFVEWAVRHKLTLNFGWFRRFSEEEAVGKSQDYEGNSAEISYQKGHWMMLKGSVWCGPCFLLPIEETDIPDIFHEWEKLPGFTVMLHCTDNVPREEYARMCEDVPASEYEGIPCP
jgi:hypothetical protein